MKIIRQFRYYGDRDNRNYPSTLSMDQLVYGNIFSECSSITQLGIQGRPGTAFFLNGQDYAIIIGETGIFEIDLQNHGQIFSIRFTSNSLDDYKQSGERLLIDIIYEG